MNNRRDFLKKATLASAGIALAATPMRAIAKSSVKKLTILHTNDIHSHIEPFSGTGSIAGKGGLARLSGMVNKVREQEKNVLLFDSGDMFQGTPYFNQYKGELMLRVMSKIGYNATTLGNHEFDNGLESLAKALRYAKFPVINSNYDLSKTDYYQYILPFYTFDRGGIRVGVYGLGVELEGLVDPVNFEGIVYKSPIEVAQKTESFLKHKKKCDVIVCLSHLGLEYTFEGQQNKISDKNLVPHTEYTDLILGGHTHTFMDEPYYGTNAKGKKVLVNQVGWGGLRLGRIDIAFDEESKQIASIDVHAFENKA